MISILLVLHFASISVLAISVLNFERKLSLELCENAQRSFGEMRQAWTALVSVLREFKIEEIYYIFQDASLTYDKKCPGYESFFRVRRIFGNFLGHKDTIITLFRNRKF